MNASTTEHKTIRAYRAPHPIVPVMAYVAGIVDGEYVCDFCGLQVYALKDGTYRHDPSEVAALDRPANWPGNAA